MATPLSVEPPFRCPRCRAALDLSSDPEPAGCSACGFPIRRIDGIPVLVPDWDGLESRIRSAQGSERASWYRASHLEEWEGPYRHHMAKRRRYVEERLAEQARARGRPRRGLDLGCGDGTHFAWLAPHVDEFHACDYNLERLRRARNVPGARRLFLADVTDLPLGDDAFDLVFFNHVLEHVPDDAAALREARRVLRRGGLCILGTPNEGAGFWQLAYRLQPRTREQTDHVHFYTAQSLARRCEDAGFIVRAVDPIGWGVPHWGLDEALRGRKWVDDAFEALGRTLLPAQATSLYALLTK